MNLCSRLKKPLQGNAKVIAELFTSFKSSDSVQECNSNTRRQPTLNVNGRQSVYLFKDISPTY